MDRRIQAAVRIIRRESHRDLPIRELAKRVNLSPWHFARLFKSETSSSPKVYMCRLKMQEAQKLLIDSFLTVKEISATLGFGDRSHFSRDFKRLCGQSPSAFRDSAENALSKEQQFSPPNNNIRHSE